VVSRILLDEGVPRHLAAALQSAGFSASAYPSLWKQTKNGELLRLAEGEGFEVLITSDKNIYPQQNLRGRNISIIVLPTNLRRQVMERAADVIAALKEIKPRQYVVIETDGRRSVSGYDEQSG
jgi:predicted nuclease of predicted toxin-antitoxin system